MRDSIVICGPVSWNHIVYLDRLPEARPHMQFAIEEFETVGGTNPRSSCARVWTLE